MARLIIKTKEQANEYLKSKNKNNIICDRYAGNMKDISSFHCNIDNYEWETNLYNVGNRSGCPCCSSLARVRTIEEVNKWLGENNKTIICTYYDGTVSSRKSKFQCLIDKYEWNTSFNSVKNGKGCPMCARINIGNALRKSQEDFVKELLQVNDSINVISKYISGHDYVKCECKICNYKWDALPSNLLKGKGCPCCAGKVVVKGINNFGYLRPDLLEYLVNKEDGNKYTINANDKIKCRCPICGLEKDVAVHNLTYHGFSCDKCSDGISYPNKYFRSFIEQTNAQDIQHEWQPEWAKPYLYDSYFIINDTEYIVEVDGGFHINDTSFSKSNDVQLRDKIKDNLAFEHNVKIIRIKAYKSNGDYLKEQILNSELVNLLDMSKVNWCKCAVDAEKNILVEVCNTYNNSSTKCLNDIVSQFKICRNTVTRYLKVGSKIGLCDYTPEKSIKYSLKRRMKSVIAYKDNKEIGTFQSLEECANKLTELYGERFISSPIGNAVKHNKTYKGFVFKYTS